MSDKPQNARGIGIFPGYTSNRDPHAQPEIATDVTNMVFHEPGKLACRKGNTALGNFANHTGSAADQVISAFPYKRAGESYIVHQDSTGDIKVGRL